MARAEPIYEVAAERPAESECEERQTHRERDRRAVPAELPLKGHDDDAGRSADGLGRHERDQRDGNDYPRVVKASDCHGDIESTELEVRIGRSGTTTRTRPRISMETRPLPSAD